MIGQDIIPGFDPMPDRLLTPQENDRWQKAKTLLGHVSDQLVALNMFNVNLALTEQFGKTHGIEPFKAAGVNPLPVAQKFSEMLFNIKKVRESVQQVEGLALALEFRSDGDINIVDPQGQLKGDMGAVLLIAAGVIVVGGLIAALVYYKKEADDLRPKYNNLLRATDKVFCDPSNPAACEDWKKLKAEKGYEHRQTVAEKIFDTVGEPVKTGLQFGTAAVVAFLALIVAMRFGGSKK